MTCLPTWYSSHLLNFMIPIYSKPCSSVGVSFESRVYILQLKLLVLDLRNWDWAKAFLWRYTVESYWESYTTCWSVRDQDQNYWLTELVRHHLIVVIDVLDCLSHCGLKVISLAPSPATTASLGAGSSIQEACVICSRYLQARSKHFQVGQVRKLVRQLLTIHRFGSGCGWLGFVGTMVLSTFIQPWWWWSIGRCLPSSLGFSLVFKLSLTCLL